jgi:hypothetical protein
MYSSLGQLVKGWSRIYYDALDRDPARLTAKLLDPLVFCQSGHLALAASLILLVLGGQTTFALFLLGLSATHHAWMYAVFRRVHATSVPGSRAAAWYPVGNLLVDVMLLRAIKMCFTGRVNWRGTEYQSVVETVGKNHDSGARG